MKKLLLFGLLVALGVVLFFRALGRDENFLNNVWSELFWLIAATISTTFVLEQVLQADEVKRRRLEDAFAFRTFVGRMLLALRQIGCLKEQPEPDPLGDAVFDTKKFAKAASATEELILKSDKIDVEAYHSRYLDMANGIRNLARDYIRYFCGDKGEMVRRFGEMQDLAVQWEYRDALTDRHRSYTESLEAGSPDRIQREAETESDRNEVILAVKGTAKYLNELAQRVTTTKGVPST